MQVRFLLGPAGSGKTYRCLAEIREELIASSEGPPLLFLAPKQATFQLERQLLSNLDLCGYTRLQILSFERLAHFILSEFSRAPRKLLNEDGRLMVLRALLAEKADELKIFRASARLPGFAQELSSILRELQQHRLSPERLRGLATRGDLPPQLSAKLHDLALLLKAYREWLDVQKLQDADRLLDLATEVLRIAARRGYPTAVESSAPDEAGGSSPSPLNGERVGVRGVTDNETSSMDVAAESHPSPSVPLPIEGRGKFHPPRSGLRISHLWLDGFAEITPQEIELLAALTPMCGQATLAFCLESVPNDEPSSLSTWSTVAQTFRSCYARLQAVPECKLSVETLARRTDEGRFGGSPALAHLEKAWTNPTPFAPTAHAIPFPTAAESCDHGVRPSSGAEVTSRDAAWESPIAARRLAIAAPEDGRAPELEVKKSRDSRPSEADRVEPCRTDPQDALKLIICANPEAEAVAAAREILRFVRSDRGRRFRDIAVLLRRWEGYAEPLRRVFKRYEIPFFLDRRESVAHHPVAELTRYALRTAAFDWRLEDLFGALKSGLIRADPAEIDCLENEALARGWEGAFWSQPPPNELDPQVARLVDGFKRKHLPPLVDFVRCVRGVWSSSAVSHAGVSGVELSEALRQLWIGSDVSKTLTEWQTAASPASQLQPAIHGTVWEQMQSWLTNIELGFQTIRLSLREWLPILEAGLGSLTVGVVPPALDQVLIGTIDRSRNPDLRFALVLGLNESVFPAVPSAKVLLDERERDALNGHQVSLGPNLHQRLALEQYFGYIACTRARERLLLSYSKSDDSGRTLSPSRFLGHLRRLFPNLQWREVELETSWIDGEHAIDVVPALLQQKAVAAPARWVAELESLPAVAARVRRVQALQEPRPDESLSPEAVAQLYGTNLETSVTHLEKFSECPFRFFVHSGLRAKERLRFEASARELGSFQHEVLKRFHESLRAEDKQWRDLTPRQARERLRQIGADLMQTFGEGLLVAREGARVSASNMIATLEDFIETAVEWLRTRYEFSPVAAELAFGSDGKLPAWKLDLSRGYSLTFRGVIDRVDLHFSDDRSSALCVILDYKSSAKKLDDRLLANGLQLQLPAYLSVLRHLSDPQTILGVPKLIPAGVFYVNLAGRFTAGAHRDEVLGDPRARAVAYRHIGRFDKRYLQNFDSSPRVPGETQTGEQFNFQMTAKGNLDGRNSDPMATEEFQALLDNVERILKDIGAGIFRGEARVSPYRLGNKTSCDFCDFKPICRHDPWTHSYRALREVTKKEA